MRPHAAALAAATLALSLAGAACTPFADVPPGTIVSCTATSDCPDGLICTAAGRCGDPAALDTTPPDLVAGSVSIQPARVRAGQGYAVTLEVSEPLDAPPVVSLGLIPPLDLDCGAPAGLVYTCAGTASGGENEGLGGDISVDVRLRDRAGNATVRSSVGTVAFDFAPPSATVASVAYLPAPENLLPAVRRATAGTRVRVAVSADERLRDTAPPTLVARLGGAALPFPLVQGGLGENDALFEEVVPAGLPDGEYALEVTWTDLAGNLGTTPVPGLALLVKTSLPSLEVDQAALVFLRSPIGNARAEDRGGYVVPAGPYFAVEPADPLSADPSLPDGALRLGGGAQPSGVLVRSGPAPGDPTLGTLSPGADGRFPRRTLVSPDLVTAWLVGLDDAGNPSPAVRLENVEWVATSASAPIGASPHRLTASPQAGPARDAGSDEVVADRAPASGAGDGAAVVARAGAPWRDRTWHGGPEPRVRHAVAYDAARGRLVVFGGDGDRGFADTWEFDGAGWTRVATAGPSERQLHAMAYDSARGRVVLFGGEGDLVKYQDTWEWDGRAWERVATTGPSPRSEHRLAFDPIRGRLVLHGGLDGTQTPLQDTWEWDGRAWTLVAADGGPGPRRSAGLAFDEARRAVTLVGGRPDTPDLDTWTWDGTAWSQVSTAGPTPRTRFGLAYDGSLGRLVLFGGDDQAGAYLPDTWTWDGSTWTQAATTGPSPRYRHAMAWDAARGRVVLLGGFDGTDYLGDTWEWDGRGWAQASAASPGPRTAHALAFDEARGRMVLFGGIDGTTWTWDGAGWNLAASLGPAPRRFALMAYDPLRERVVLFGGDDFLGNGLGETWEWDGAGWSLAATTGPDPTAAPSMAFDPITGRILLCGGATGPGGTLGTWAWDGAGWSQLAIAGPAVPGGHLMATAPDGVVLFAGFDGVTFRADTWAWDGAAWRAVAAPGPATRTGFAMAYDAARQRSVLVGGTAYFGELSARLADLWEWDGATWLEVPGAGPRGRDFPALGYDAARRELVMVGGAGPAELDETWTLSRSPAEGPALQFLASDASLGVAPAAVARISVRAFAGGAITSPAAADVGATLHGWTARGPRGEPGAWVPLDSNAAGLGRAAPIVTAGPAARLAWTSPSAEAARALLVEGDGLALRVSPRAVPGATAGGAAVALDYLEVRVRYVAP